AEHHVWLSTQLERQRVARSRWYPRRHRAVVIGNDAVVLDVGEKQPKLPSVRRCLVLAEPPRHHVPRIDTSVKIGREIPRYHRDQIAFLEPARAPNRSSFLSDSQIDCAEDFSLPVQQLG